MDPATIQLYLQLYASAFAIGEAIYGAVKNVVKKKLTREDYLQLESYWDEDVAQSALNAGIPYVPPTQLPPTD